MILWSLVLEAWSFHTSAQSFNVPPRPPSALTGTEFTQKITSLNLRQREAEIFTEITSGNVPTFLRKLSAVQVTNVANGTTNHGTFYVTPDYLAVGSDDDYILMPISPITAQRIADATGCSLPPRKMVDAIYSAALVKLAPEPIPPSAAMTTVLVFSDHNVMVRTQRVKYLTDFPLGSLVAGHQKDVVVSARLSNAPGKVAIYGWHQTNGVPIQPLYLGHAVSWVDYSQCTRLVQNQMLVNGTNTTVAQVLADPELSALLSDEGPISKARYPTNEIAPSLTNEIPTPVTEQNSKPANFKGFLTTNTFEERIASFTMNPEINVLINAPASNSVTACNEVLLVFYALPNGNTIEQTIGKTPRPGDDWHFDIQHIGAQTRFLRSVLPNKSLVVVYLENNLQSWPAWRKKYGDKLIPGVIDSVKNLFATNTTQVALNSHSGGGSFIFGYINAMQNIPDDVVRIGFLDSNYAYDRALGHKDKLVRWLTNDNHRFLCILAYNDAAGLLNGKPFVSAAGGTWGKSHAMQHDLAEAFNFSSNTNGLFERFSALDGRVQFILRENPARKILHTTQVELNGFIHSILSGTTNESKGYEYFGERAYSKWIDAQSVPEVPAETSRPR